MTPNLENIGAIDHASCDAGRWLLTIHDGTTVRILDKSKNGVNPDWPAPLVCAELPIEDFAAYMEPETFWRDHRHLLGLHDLNPALPEGLHDYVSKRDLQTMQAWTAETLDRYRQQQAPGRDMPKEAPIPRTPKKRVIFDVEKYDLDYLRETRDSYEPMTDAEFEDAVSYDMGEDELRVIMEAEWHAKEQELDGFLGKSILVRWGDANPVQFNFASTFDLTHARNTPITMNVVDKVWDEDGHLFISGSNDLDGHVTVEIRLLTEEGAKAMDEVLKTATHGDRDSAMRDFYDMWDNPALVTVPRYAETALGLSAEENLAELPLNRIEFAEEISEYDGKLNFYIPVTFDCDAVFGTDVCTTANDDWLNIYVDYDMESGKVADHLDLSLNRADGDIEYLTYPLDESQRDALLPKMDTYCKHATGKTLTEYAKEAMDDAEPSVSLKAAAKECRGASEALAGDATPDDRGREAR